MSTLSQYPEKLAIVRFGPGAEIPAWAESASLFGIIATAKETAVICATRSVPNKVVSLKPLTGFLIEGQRDVDDATTLVDLLNPLAEAGIPARVVTTYSNEWLLVPQSKAEAAVEEWRRRGHTVAPAVPVTPSRKGTS
ncbi:ACT domain-containing protein [Nocardioides sp. Bht2]|uniref:ACT domain-containing protein n=1 Tax=Nocardioides sp. Bht2 TaxID=3392297 RepID=UPI0039B495A5